MLIAARGASVLAISLAILVGLTACGGAQSRFDSHMKRGNSYSAAGDFTKASVEFRNALQIEPKNDVARLAAGHAAEKLKRPRDAYGLYQSVVDASPDNVDARIDLARFLVYSGSAQQALKVIEPGLAKHPDNATLLTFRAAARVELKDRDGATADAERALQLAPDSVDAIQVRAGLYKQVGELAAARTLVQNAVAKTPTSVSLREMLVDLALTAKDPDQAERVLGELIKLAPDQPQYRFRLAMLYSQTNRLDDAQRVLEDATEAFPKRDEVKLALVDFLNVQRSPALAQKTLRGFIAQSPDDYRLRLGLGSLLLNSGAMQEAIDTYKEVVHLDGTGPSALEARDRLADIAVRQGHEAEATELTDEVLKKNVSDNDSLARRAMIELSHSDPAGAIGDLRALLRDRPQSVPAQRLIARAYVMNGQPGLAEQALHAAMDAAPRDTGVRDQLAQLLMSTRRPDQAVALLEDSVRIAPKDSAVRVALIQAYLGKKDFAQAHKGAADLKTMTPDSATGFYLEGMADVGENKLDEGQKEFEKALALQPRAFDTLSALVRLHVARKQPVEALVLLNSAVERDPKSAPILNLLGELYFAQHDDTHAFDAWTRALAIAPQWWVLHRNIGFAKLSASDVPGSITEYEAALKAAPAEMQLVSELGAIYETHGRVEDAISLYDGAYRRYPHVPAVANNLAMLLVNHRTDRASLDRARDLTADFASSTDGTLLDTNGWVRFKRGEYSEALPVLGRAVDRAPNSKEIRYHLGMAELHAGETDRARADLETAVSGASKFYGADEARTTLASLKNTTG
jgi:tetratricopeptide (TPR) repeat protein